MFPVSREVCKIVTRCLCSKYFAKPPQLFTTWAVSETWSYLVSKQSHGYLVKCNSSVEPNLHILPPLWHFYLFVLCDLALELRILSPQFFCVLAEQPQSGGKVFVYLSRNRKSRRQYWIRSHKRQLQINERLGWSFLSQLFMGGFSRGWRFLSPRGGFIVFVKIHKESPHNVRTLWKWHLQNYPLWSRPTEAAVTCLFSSSHVMSVSLWQCFLTVISGQSKKSALSCSS